MAKIKSASQIEQEVFKLIKFGFDENAITTILNGKVNPHDWTESQLMNMVSDLIDEYPDYEFIQNFVRSKIIVNSEGFFNLPYHFWGVPVHTLFLNLLAYCVHS